MPLPEGYVEEPAFVEEAGGIHMPSPSYYPIIAAFGLVTAGAGLVFWSSGNDGLRAAGHRGSDHACGVSSAGPPSRSPGRCIDGRCHRRRLRGA